MSYNNWSARHKQSKPGEFRQYRNPGQEVSLKNGMHGHPMHDGPKYLPKVRRPTRKTPYMPDGQSAHGACVFLLRLCFMNSLIVC